MDDFGPHKYGAELEINPPIEGRQLPNIVAVDVETDERDNFVGMGVCGSPKHVMYFSKLVDISGKKILTCGGKADIRWLKNWGIKVSYDDIYCDVSVLDYSINSYGKHGLKNMAKRYLEYEWPTYEEMVGKGKKKITLDKQPINRVARYCGMDALAAYNLYECMWQKKVPHQSKKYYLEVEFPFYKAVAEMEERGAMVNISGIKELDYILEKELVDLESTAIEKAGMNLNVRSPQQVMNACKHLKIKCKSTGAEALKEHSDHEFVKALLNYREAFKLRSAFTAPLLKRPDIPRIRTTFNTTRTITGRISSKNPNLQQIPSRTERGVHLRNCFIPKEGSKLVVADYSQIELRVFAHLSAEPLLLNAYRNDEDIHDKVAATIGSNRNVAKTFGFGSLYGAGPKRLAVTADIPENEARKLLDAYWGNMPAASAWVTRMKWDAYRRGGVRTIFNRFIPIHDIKSSNIREKKAAERKVVNYTIQGSAAEIIKIAMIRLRENGVVPILQVHDELVFEVLEERAEEVSQRVKEHMEQAVTLSVPLKVNVKICNRWGEMK